MQVRKAIIYALAAGACFMAAIMAPKRVQASQIEDAQAKMVSIYVETRHCMVYAASDLLRKHGTRDPQALATFAMLLCSSTLRRELVTHGGYTIEETEPLLRFLASESAQEALSGPRSR